MSDIDKLSKVPHASRTESAEELQAGNRSFWNSNPMDYHWTSSLHLEEGTLDWFNAIDQGFIESADLYGIQQPGDTPFSAIIPLQELNGKRILEIGCGQGLHSELMARAGADLTSIDITPRAINNTRKRLQLKGLSANVMLMDAVEMDFPDQSFDFVWSWGVIHHSGYTGRIVRQISRVLKPDGEARIMVYNRDALLTQLIYLYHYWLRGERSQSSVDEILWKYTDGYLARHYTQDQLRDFFHTFFDRVDIRVMDQESGILPLPRRLRNWFLKRMTREQKIELMKRRGWFLFLTARNPF